LGLNRIQEEKPPTDEDIKQFLQSGLTKQVTLPQEIIPQEFSDGNISAFLRGVSVAPESTVLSGISQDRQLTPSVGAGIKPREVDPLAGFLGIADTIPFIDEIPGVRERFEKARRIAPGAFKFGQIGGTLATGVGALAGAKALIRFTPKVISSIAKRAIPLLTNNKKAQIILARAGIDVVEGAIADGLFNAIQGELPNAKDLAIFAAVDAALPTVFKVVGKVVKKLKPTKEIIPEAKKIIPGAQKKILNQKEVPSGTQTEKAKQQAKAVPEVEREVEIIAEGLFKGEKGKIVGFNKVSGTVQVETAKSGIVEIPKSGLKLLPLKPTKIPVKAPQVPSKPLPTAEVPGTTTKPVSTGEAIKLPKETKFRETTSARKFDMSKDREVIGLNELNSPERKTFQTSLDNAKAKGFDEKALDLADEVLEKPKAFNDEETAGVVLKSVEIKNTHEDLHRQLKKAVEGSAVEKTLLADIERAEEKFDKLSEALRVSGTEKGRALVSQKLTLNRDYSLAPVLNRAKVAKQHSEKGAQLTAKERAKLKELTDKLSARDKRVAELEKEVNRRTANVVLRRSKGTKEFAKMSRVERDAALESTVAKAKKLIDEGCIISG